MQRGLFEEEANRNLDAAAQAYQAVSARFDRDRKLAATAIFRLGEVYRKQGKTNEAVAQYERIVREFADEPTLATLSRKNLGALKQSPVLSDVPMLTGLREARTQDAALLERVKKLTLPEARQLLPTLVPDELLTKLLEQYQTTEAKRVEQAVNYAPDHPEMRALDNRLKKLDEQIQERIAGIIKALEIRLAATPPATVSVGLLTQSTPTDDEEKEIRRIQAMIQNSPDLINAPSGEDKLTPLCRAASKGQLQVARFLIEARAAIDRPANGSTPLHFAAAAGHRAMTDLLLERGADVNARDSDGRTPLHLAAENGFQAVADGLLARNADVNATSSGQATPLHLAASKGHGELVKFLISKSAKLEARDESGFTAVSRAAARGHSEAVAALLAAGANPNLEDNSGRTPLSLAAGTGHLECVKALLAAKADPNAGKLDLPLAQAVYRRRYEIAETLLRAGADPNLAGKFSLHLRPPDGNPLPAAGSSIYSSYVPLQIAMSSRDVAMVKLLLKYKADPNTKDPWFTPIKPLIFFTLGYDELLKAFLDAGADAKAKDGHGQGILVAAAGYGLGPVELLLAAGADVHARGLGGDTALHAAAGAGRKEVVARLLAAGADVNARDVAGTTPLHRAVGTGNREIVELLLKHGADPNVRDDEGETPLGWAKSPKPRPGLPVTSPSPDRLTEIAALLRQHGALDELPRLDRIELRRRRGDSASVTVLPVSTNGWNEFSLLELLAHHYGFIFTDRNAVWEVDKPTLPSRFWRAAACQFPDFDRVVIRRAAAEGTRWTEISVNVTELLDSGDCTRDVKLAPGDVVELAELDHPVNERWPGLGEQTLSNLLHCVSRTVTIFIKGAPTQVPLAPAWRLTNSVGAYGERMSDLTKGSFMLKSVLAQSRLLRASSDLSRVKVTRRAGGKTQEWLVDCSHGHDPDLWLRDGDVIEVPDKP